MDRPLYAYAYAHVRYDDAIAMLAQDPQDLLQDAIDASVEHAHEVHASLHVPIGGFDLGRDVIVHLGTFQPVEQLRGTLPLRWEAATGQILFPTVHATLEIGALAVHSPGVQVTLVGSYTPPLGPVGGALDRAVTHRLAESVVHRFVQDVAERLEARVVRAVDLRLAEVAVDHVREELAQAAVTQS